MSEENDKSTKLSQLAKLAQSNAEYINDRAGRTYAKIKYKSHNELYSLRGINFENWLSLINYKEFEEIATSKLKSDVVLHLEGITRFSGETHDVVDRHGYGVPVQDLEHIDYPLV